MCSSSIYPFKFQANCLREMDRIVIVFDFDKTIIELDSDNWVVDELGASELFDHLLPTMPWNTLMDAMMKELHSRGSTIADIVHVLTRAPIHPRVIPAIRTAYALGCDLRVVSDANSFFIETILEHLGIRECFSEIQTNPSYVDEEGRLRISPYHDFHSCSHGCDLCPPNMCKGKIIEKMQARDLKQKQGKRMIYLGDGAGDFCPSLRLREADFMMPRKNFPVWDLMCKNRSLVKAEVREWKDGEELERVLLCIIHNIINLQLGEAEVAREEEEEEDEEEPLALAHSHMIMSQSHGPPFLNLMPKPLPVPH